MKQDLQRKKSAKMAMAVALVTTCAVMSMTGVELAMSAQGSSSHSNKTTASVDAGNQTVTLEGLLREMVDRDRVAEFPSSAYRTLQASSYNRVSVTPDDPATWFENSDGTGFIRTEQVDGKTEWVLMEDEGPGAITKIWAVCFYLDMSNTTGANLKIYLDGAHFPVINTNFFQFVKGQTFVKPPLAAETTRAGNSYLPIPYAKGCKVTMDKLVFYNSINYRSYPAGTKVETFSMDVLKRAEPLLEEVNATLKLGASADNGVSGKLLHQQKKGLSGGESFTVNLPKGSRAVKRLTLKVTANEQPQALRSTVLKAIFDGEQTIWTPVGDFFCGTIAIKPYTMWERAVSANGEMTTCWVMPYKESGQFVFENLGTQPVDIDISILSDKWNWTENSMHFHSNWQTSDPTPTLPMIDYNLLEAEGRGVYVGDQLTVLNPEVGWWGEGDEKIYTDSDFDRNFPSHFGTGTEDYYGWAGGIIPTPNDEFCKPFLGNILVGSPDARGYNICTRTRVLDDIPFRQKLKMDIEANCLTRTTEWFHLLYSMNTYWYAVPGVTHNRTELSKFAARNIMTLQELQLLNEKSKAAGEQPKP